MSTGPEHHVAVEAHLRGRSSAPQARGRNQNIMLNGETIRLDGGIRMQPK